MSNEEKKANNQLEYIFSVVSLANLIVYHVGPANLRMERSQPWI